jgi:hypothetical protein
VWWEKYINYGRDANEIRRRREEKEKRIIELTYATE